jgi:hypothetical protein
MGLERHALLLERLRRALDRTGQSAVRRRASRPFSGTTARRLLLVTIDERIPQSQVHPFHHFAGALRERHDVEVREATLDDWLGGAPCPAAATTVCFQTAFDIPRAELEGLVAGFRARNPGARLIYLDWFAPTDLRLAEALDPHVAVYVKKHVLRDRSLYGRPTLGDTNLVEHYSRRFELAAAPRCFPIPEGFLDKLVVGPPFATADFMLRGFLGEPPRSERPIDMHARLAMAGTPWYQRMRGECVAALDRVPDLQVVSGTGVGHVAYMRELRASKVCFSPFGYGEVCWRDYEAILSGAVLLKPDMSHIETDPDVFVAGETYMPVRWDLADFEVQVRRLIASPELRAELAGNAFAVLRDYLRSGRFVDRMGALLA